MHSGFPQWRLRSAARIARETGGHGGPGDSDTQAGWPILPARGGG